jgi:CRP-like cAMP-binding protein
VRALLLRYAHVFMVQVAATALADGRYSIEQRLARWLLMCHDRNGDDLALTHEFLALMLGVRRPGVTESLHILEGERMIKAQRGLITILDRQKLEARAGDSYGTPEAEYERLIGPFRRSFR